MRLFDRKDVLAFLSVSKDDLVKWFTKPFQMVAKFLLR